MDLSPMQSPSTHRHKLQEAKNEMTGHLLVLSLLCIGSVWAPAVSARKVAIVGGGIGGSIAAYILRNSSDGKAPEVHV